MPVLKSLVSSFQNTNGGFIVFIAAIFLPAIGVIVHCGFNIWQGKALEPYDLIIMDHPVLTNLGVTYLEVLIGDVITLFAVLVGLVWRHHHYRDERDFIKKYNIRAKSGFAQDFRFSGGDQRHHYDSDHDE